MWVFILSFRGYLYDVFSQRERSSDLDSYQEHPTMSISFIAFFVGVFFAQMNFSTTKKSKPEKPKPDTKEQSLEALLKAYFLSQASQEQTRKE